MENEQRRGREGTKEGKRRKVLFRISMVGNGSLNSTQGGKGGRKERREGFVHSSSNSSYRGLSSQVRRAADGDTA